MQCSELGTHWMGGLVWGGVGGERGCQESQGLFDSMQLLVGVLGKHPQEKTWMWWL